MVTLAISGTTIGEAKSPRITFQQATEAVHQPHTLFHLPLSELTFERWLELQTIMAQFTLNDSPDQWVCIWRSLFSCSKTYRSIIDHADTKKNSHDYGNTLVGQRTWFSSDFFWKISLAQGICWNIELQSYGCVLYGADTKESLDHLFLQCPFALACRHFVDIQVDGNLLQRYKCLWPSKISYEFLSSWRL